VSAGREMQPPLRLEVPTDPDGSAVQQRISYAFECPQRLTVDALGRHNHEPPANLVQLLAPVDVTHPLARILSMLPTVVLNDQPNMLIRHVVTPAPCPVPPPNDQVDTGLGKAGKHEQAAEPGFLWGVHTLTRQGCRSARHTAAPTVPLSCGLDESLR